MRTHPNTWVGKYFTNIHTLSVDKVKEVKRNGKRYTVLLDSENPFMALMGYDYITFRKNWI